VRALVAAGLLLAAALFFAAGGHEALGFDSLKAHRAQAEIFYRDNPLTTLAGFFLLYLALGTAALPGGVPLTILAGALFGTLTAVLLVSFAASIGALLAFFLGRYVMRDWLLLNHKEKIEIIDDEIDKRGIYYLFTLRFVPIFPLFIINFGSGLTRMRPATYYGVSQLGMLPGQVLFAAAGSGLAALELDAEVWMPGLLWAIELLRAP